MSFKKNSTHHEHDREPLSLNGSPNRRADADDGERHHRRPVAAWVVVSIGKEHVSGLPSFVVPVAMLVPARFLGKADRAVAHQ